MIQKNCKIKLTTWRDINYIYVYRYICGTEDISQHFSRFTLKLYVNSLNHIGNYS